MENQHRKIKGYRELTQDEIDLMNEIKQWGQDFGKLVERVNNVNAALEVISLESEPFRWSAIAKTDAQTACMALTRAVAKPDFF